MAGEPDRRRNARRNLPSLVLALVLNLLVIGVIASGHPLIGIGILVAALGALWAAMVARGVRGSKERRRR